MATAVKQERLEQLIAAHAPLVIAYSGGVDSSYLLAIAVKTVSDRCLGVIADSPSLPREALKNAVALALDIRAKLEIIATREMDNRSYGLTRQIAATFARPSFSPPSSHSRGRVALPPSPTAKMRMTRVRSVPVVAPRQSFKS